jgi:hypothetical protein
VCEKYKPPHLFGKGEGTFQFGTGERKTHVARLRERL